MSAYTRTCIPALACWLVLLAGTAAADMTAWGTDLASRPAMPYIIVPPDYPKEALAKGVTATVDVKGWISRDGTFERASYSASIDDPSFQKAIEEVLHYWTFIAPASETGCERVGGEAQLRVWFEIQDAKPKVSISSPPSKYGKGPGGITVEPIDRVTPVYPRKAIQKNIQGGRVVALSKVGPDGRVQEITFQDTRADKLFHVEAQRALKEWTYEISPEAFKDKPYICIEHQLNFTLR